MGDLENEPKEYQLSLNGQPLGVVTDEDLGKVTLNGSTVRLGVKELAGLMNENQKPTKPIYPELMTEPEFQEMRYSKEQ